MSKSNLEKLIEKQNEEVQEAQARFNKAVKALSETLRKRNMSDNIKRGIRAAKNRKVKK